MKLSDSNISGLILSAGASERMGRPKALLDDGKTTLLAKQVALLLQGGCGDITVVVGADAEEIMRQHEELKVGWAINDDWQQGQFSSLQVGLRDMLAGDPVGTVVLPVDVVCVAVETVTAIIETALLNLHLGAIVPEYNDNGGHPIYLSRNFCERLLALDPKDDASRLDMQIQNEREAMRLPVSDANVTKNINTPEEWEGLKGTK